MKKAFLETSAIDHAYRAGMDAPHLSSLLSGLESSPALGMHVIYELARIFLGGENLKTGCCIFQLLNELDLSFQPPTDQLLRQELISLRTNAAVLPFMNTVNQASARTEIAQLASGNLTDEARSFIETLEADAARGHPQWADSVVSQVRALRRSDPTAVPRLKSLDDTVSYFEGQRDALPKLVQEVFRLQGDLLSRSESAEFVARLDSFPAVRSMVRAQCYLTLICVRDGHAPSFNNVGDYRHVIDASYCEVFLTSDKGLTSVALLLNPAR